MKTNHRLRLIAVKPNEGCDSKYRKILKTEFYIFYNDYTIESGKLTKKTGLDLKEAEVPVNFFNADGDININISAIIGKNGDGKSTIVELAMRILNNFAYVTGFPEKQSSLSFIKGLCAELYYEIGDSLYSIISKDDIVTWKIPKRVDIVLSNKESKENNKKQLKDIALGDHFFYTQVSNYSLYAYNSNELVGESENGQWIDGVFHKNDGYQTPIVLHPMRTEGNIDVNIENDLSRQRLISLLMEDSFREINEKQTVKAFQIKLFEYSKLEQKTLLDFFKNYAQQYRQDYFAHLIDKTKGIDQYINDIQQATKLSLSFKDGTLDITDEFKGMITLLNTLYNITSIDKNIFDRYLNTSEVLYREIKKIRNTMNIYIGCLERLTMEKRINQSWLLKENISQKIEDVQFFFKRPPISMEDLDFDAEELVGHFNFTYLQRIITVSICEEIWLKKTEQLHIKREGNVYDKIIQYIVYKTLSIISKYPNYKDLSVRIFTAIDFINEAERIDDLKRTINDAVEKIWNDVNGDKTHITLKIRQCFNFLKNHPYGNADYKVKEDKYVDISTFYDKVISLGRDAKKNPYDYFFPAIFEVDVLLQQKDNEWGEKTSNDGLFMLYDREDKLPTPTLLSQLSSGERQQINTVSSIIYHLRNIDSVAKNESNLIKYQYVNLIFEEIELYFHPEFQRAFLDFLLRHISRSKLNLKSINLCFVTHSPFILSDIPQQNILVLKEGNPNLITFNTLGANIHEMLANDFMLDFTVGEIVKKKIDSFLKKYSEFKAGNNNKTDVSEFIAENNIEFLVSNMGDGYLKSIIKGYYEEMRMSTPDELSKLIEEKRKELKELEEKQNKK